MEALIREYERLIDLQEFCGDELDYAILERHKEELDRLAKMSNNGVTIYDMYQRRHVFTSFNFPDLFDYDMERIDREDSEYFTLQIHPDDVFALNLNGVKCLRYAMESGVDSLRQKLIQEYRINLNGRYVRAIEQFQVLERDCWGNVWLSLSFLDISPSQTPFTKVESRIFDVETRRVMPMPDYPEYRMFEKDKPGLTNREKEVLQLVREGFLSKEISDRMRISLNTVNTYRQRIIEKLDVNNSQEAIRYAEKLGLLE